MKVVVVLFLLWSVSALAQTAPCSDQFHQVVRAFVVSFDRQNPTDQNTTCDLAFVDLHSQYPPSASNRIGDIRFVNRLECPKGFLDTCDPQTGFITYHLWDFQLDALVSSLNTAQYGALWWLSAMSPPRGYFQSYLKSLGSSDQKTSIVVPGRVIKKVSQDT